ncbi:MAG: TIR domain-containing protein, partial [Synechococcaceae cyanobacterium]
MATHHVFISYAHIDNVPITEEQQGWISRFHSTLEVFLSQRLGGRDRIWRDLKLQGNDVFGDEIVDAFRDTTLFFSILTPRYVRSDWCKREIQEFCHHAEQTDGLVIENKSRVYKVIKTPVDRNTAERLLPPVVRDSLGYEFFVQDAQGPIELDPDFGERYKQDYL